MNTENSTTTRQEVVRVYPLADGRTMGLQRARTFRPVKVYKEGEQLYAGALQVVLKRLEFLKRSVGDLTGLVRFIDEQGAYFPGVHLYDTLLRPQGRGLVPFFSLDTMIVFLGSRVTCVSNALPRVEYQPPSGDANSSSQKPGLLGKLKNWISGRELGSSPALIQYAVSVTASETGYLVIKRDGQGEVQPWFISQEDLMEAILREDDAIFVVYAREPE
ncbi:MAG: hypothetical protein WAV09_01015 [Minisyncoccia bacterium]